jgi:hypothetical protein
MKSESEVEAALLKVKSLCIWCVLLNVPQSRSKNSREDESFLFPFGKSRTVLPHATFLFHPNYINIAFRNRKCCGVLGMPLTE